MKRALCIALLFAVVTGCASQSGRPQMWIDHIDPRAEQHASLTWVSYAADGTTTQSLAIVDTHFRAWLASPTMEAGPNGARMNIDTDNPTTAWGKIVEVFKAAVLYVAGRNEVIAIP